MVLADIDLEGDEFADHILVISSRPSVEKEILQLLKKRLYKYEHVSSALEATRLKTESLFDLIVLDFAGQSSDAALTLKRLRAKADFQNCPVLLLHPEPSRLTQGSEEGFSVLQTPFEPPQFVVRTATLLSARRSGLTFDLSPGAKAVSQNVQLRELTKKFGRDLREARHIQQSLLPKALPVDERVSFSAVYLPLEAVGGDLYDIWRIRDGLYGMFIGDVTGHGLPAALLGAITKMALTYSVTEDPGQMLEGINDGITDFMPEGKFVTIAAGVYETASGRLLLARAGHPEPFVWRKRSNSIETLGPKGLPVGFLEGAQYQTLETVL